MVKNAYALIMAGGAGTRLWPLSRKNQPKPLLNLIEKDRSMFQISVDRLEPLIPHERILVVASAELSAQLKEQAPKIPAENFIVEPSGRDTAPAVGLGAIQVLHRDPQAVMAVLTADHYIADEAMFRKALQTAIEAASAGGVVTLGITPDFPSTGFGYIERGEKTHTLNGIDIYALQQFREKPDEATAANYVESGRYSWNSGMFIWPAQRVMDEFERHSADIHASLIQIADAIGLEAYASTLAELWPTVRRVSVDYALLEHINSDIFVIPVEMGWQDIGNFGTLYDILSGGKGVNIAQSDIKPVIVDTNGTMIFSKKLVTTIGLDDLIIVETEDTLLICSKDRAQDVKLLVQKLQEENRNEYL